MLSILGFNFAIMLEKNKSMSFREPWPDTEQSPAMKPRTEDPKGQALVIRRAPHREAARSRGGTRLAAPPQPGRGWRPSSRVPAAEPGSASCLAQLFLFP